jgi:hypothetical protein
MRQRKTLLSSFHKIKRLKSRRELVHERTRAYKKSRRQVFEALEIEKIQRCCCLQIQKDERFLCKFCECVHFSFHVLQNTRLIKRLQFAFLVRAAAAVRALLCI